MVRSDDLPAYQTAEIPAVRPAADWLHDGRRQPVALPIKVVGVCSVAAVLVSAFLLFDARKPAAVMASDASSPRFGVDVVVSPAGADLYRNGAAIGRTPMSLSGRQGEAIVLEIAKPGYLPQTVRGRAGRAGDPTTMMSATLVRVDGFAGGWTTAAGEPLTFSRVNDDVVVSSSAAPPRRFGFEPGDATSVVFAADQEVRDPRRSADVSCRASARVEYRYTPQGDRLEVRREQVTMTLVEPRCDVVDRVWSVATRLQRVAR
ncbi:MAG: hypothetical protein KBG15_17140 [Kofleriaceae bacterium]|nr:hypothetical protein [Kofleriaceae bacterium]